MTIPLLPDDPHDRGPAAAGEAAGLGEPDAGGAVSPRRARRRARRAWSAPPAAAGLGAKVALVERDLLGGDCLNVGCVPSKTLLRAARAVAEIRRAREFGVKVAEPEIDFAAVMSRVRRVRAELAPVDSAERYRSLGVDVFLGEGKFVNEDTVEVDGAKLHFGRCVIATGSRPTDPRHPRPQGLAVVHERDDLHADRTAETPARDRRRPPGLRARASLRAAGIEGDDRRERRVPAPSRGPDSWRGAESPAGDRRGNDYRRERIAESGRIRRDPRRRRPATERRGVGP